MTEIKLFRVVYFSIIKCFSQRYTFMLIFKSQTVFHISDGITRETPGGGDFELCVLGWLTDLLRVINSEAQGRSHKGHSLLCVSFFRTNTVLYKYVCTAEPAVAQLTPDQQF